ncbi:MAG: serine/threonine-protein kinase [Byssovorax sp.]
MTSGGSNLGKYRLIAELGHGGMAEVFLAVVRGPAGFNKLMVIKQIRPQLAEDPEFLSMFLDEARLAARLSHPNVVQTNEVGHEAGRYFIAMEYLEGQPLNRVLHRFQRSGGFPLGLHLRVISEVLAGLHHAHEITDYDGTPLGVVHRDVTPHNIFLTYDGQVKVVDFGIAKAMNSSSETRTGVLKGKVAYMAPEQARGERVDRRADLFSVGILLWEAATGKRLWKGVPDIAILQRLLNGDIPTPRSVNPDVPEVLEAIILKCLATDRDGRYDTATELQADIDSYLDAQDERVNVRDLSKLMTRHFDADRLKIKAIIEEQLRVKTTSSFNVEAPRGLPLIDDRISLTATGTNPAIGDRSSHDSGPSSIQITGVGPASSGVASSPSYSSPSGLFASAAPSAADAARPGRRGVVAGAAIGVGGLLAIVFFVVTRTPAAPAPLATTAPTGAAAAAAAPPPTASEVEINVSASPPDARIFLDDRPLDHNPYKGVLAAEAGPHQLRVEARGYTTQSRSISLDRNVVLELALQKDAGVASNPPAAVVRGAPPPPPPVDDGMTRPAVKPRRTLDTSNPYAK